MILQRVMDVIFPKRENIRLVVVVVREGLDDDPSIVAGGKHAFIAWFCCEASQHHRIPRTSKPNLIPSLLFPITAVMQKRKHRIRFVENRMRGIPPIDRIGKIIILAITDAASPQYLVDRPV